MSCAEFFQTSYNGTERFRKHRISDEQNGTALENTESTPSTNLADGITPDYAFVNTVGRIAIYDDLRSAPRVMEIQPDETAAYIDTLAMTVYQQAQAAGGTIPHMVIREVSENFIHAQFKEIVVSILDRGKTIRFADHGPGIPSKEKVQQPGFTSASDPMRTYIRGVGSGLPIVREYLAVSDGTITIEDNLGTGAVVTVSLVREEDDPLDDWTEQPLDQAVSVAALVASAAEPAGTAGAAGAAAMAPMPDQAAYAGMPQQPAGYGLQPAQVQQAPAAGSGYGYPTSAMPMPAYQQPAYPQTAYPQPGYAQPAYQPYPQPYPPAAYPAYGAQPGAPMGYPAAVMPAPHLSDFQRQLLKLVAREGMLSNKEIVEMTGRADATVSQNLSTLTDLGLVEKMGNKRVLTPYGQQIVPTL